MTPANLNYTPEERARLAALRLPPAAKERIRKEFQRVMAESCLPYAVGQLKLWSSEEEEFIRREVERKLFVPKLASAGEPERKWVEMLQRIAGEEFWQHRTAAEAAGFTEDRTAFPAKSVGWLRKRAEMLAGSLAALLPGPNMRYDQFGRSNVGCYYFWHPVTAHSDKLTYKWANELRAAAILAQEWEVKWFADLLLGGTNRPGGVPEAVSDFQMEPLFSLRRWNDEVVRKVRLRNFTGEVGRLQDQTRSPEILTLDADSFKSPEMFRRWCLQRGHFSWSGNQTHLQDLQWDTNRETAWRLMVEIDCMGWTPLRRRGENGKETWESATPGLLHGVWVYGDAMYHEGKLIESDSNSTYWVGGQGYFVEDRGRESEYALGMPMMHPGVNLGDLLSVEQAMAFRNPPAPKAVKERETAKGKAKGGAGGTYAEADLLRTYFQEISERFYETVGGWEAMLSLGAIFAYAAAPEIFAKYGLFPGLWVHGQMSSGKTKFTEWLLHLVGFDRSAGVSALKSTTVGILQESQNYSNLPLWIDEFRQGQVKEETVGLFRDAYNRQPPVKWNPEGVHRKIRTAFLISGESTTSDAAARSRYPHVQISAARRIGNHLVWFSEHRKNFFVYWRMLMERRAEFVKLTLRFLEMFVAKDHGTGEREKFVHGIDWAAWRAMESLLGLQANSEFDDFILEHMRLASRDVVAETNINVFWTDLITAFELEAIPLELFRVELADDGAEYPPGQAWNSYRLFFEPGGVISALAAHLRKQGSAVSLRRNDLRDQLSKNRYWITGKLRKRFGHGLVGGVPAWGIEVDEHPLGKQEVTPDEFEAALRTPERDEDLKPDYQTHYFKADGDPRKGQLFCIVDAVLRRDRKRQETEEQDREERKHR